MIDYNDMVFLQPPPINRYYVYFDKATGDITALANSIMTTPGFTDYIEIPPVMHERLSSGNEKIHQWMVSAVTTPDSEPSLELIPRKFEGLSFKNNMFDLVLDYPNSDTELIVEWSMLTKHWVFSITSAARERLAGKQFVTNKLSFFVVLEHDFDFLIRTIYISPYQLVDNKVYVPFTTTLEHQIGTIAVVTRRIFNSYGLVKTYE